MAASRKLRNLVLRCVKPFPRLYEPLCQRWNVNSLNYWDEQYAVDTADERWNAELRLQFYDLAARALPEEPATILDVGSGLGWGPAHLAKSCPDWHVEGLDFSQEACRKAVVKTHCCDLRTDALPGEYDYILAVETLEHFSQPMEVLEKLYGYARKAVILTVPYASEISTLHPFRFDEHTFKDYPDVTVELSKRRYEPTGEIKTDMLVVLPKAAADVVQASTSK